ncbi:hypothetical protein C5167_006101, partial [Papaver somniferum]
FGIRNKEQTIWHLKSISNHSNFNNVPLTNYIPSYPKILREGGLYTIEKLQLTTAKSKFRPAQSEKRVYFWWNTSLFALDAYSVSIIPHNFCFTEFEALESNLQNIHITGYLKNGCGNGETKYLHCLGHSKIETTHNRLVSTEK